MANFDQLSGPARRVLARVMRDEKAVEAFWTREPEGLDELYHRGIVTVRREHQPPEPKTYVRLSASARALIRTLPKRLFVFRNRKLAEIDYPPQVRGPFDFVTTVEELKTRGLDAIGGLRFGEAYFFDYLDRMTPLVLSRLEPDAIVKHAGEVSVAEAAGLKPEELGL